MNMLCFNLQNKIITFRNILVSRDSYSSLLLRCTSNNAVLYLAFSLSESHFLYRIDDRAALACLGSPLREGKLQAVQLRNLQAQSAYKTSYRVSGAWYCYCLEFTLTRTRFFYTEFVNQQKFNYGNSGVLVKEPMKLAFLVAGIFRTNARAWDS